MFGTIDLQNHGTMVRIICLYQFLSDLTCATADRSFTGFECTSYGMVEPSHYARSTDGERRERFAQERVNTCRFTMMTMQSLILVMTVLSTMMTMQSLILIRIIRLAILPANLFMAEIIETVHCATRAVLTANVAAEPQFRSMADEPITKTEQKRDYEESKDIDAADGYVSERYSPHTLQMRAGSTDDKKALARRARRRA